MCHGLGTADIHVVFFVSRMIGRVDRSVVNVVAGLLGMVMSAYVRAWYPRHCPAGNSNFVSFD